MSRQFAAACPFVSPLRRVFATLLCATLLLGCAFAEDGVAVPRLVKFSGTMSGAAAGSVGVIFALYKDQTGGAPLWQEVQTVGIDSGGHYTALLGARSATGVPLELFSNGEARWLGVQGEGQPEQARVLLVSVPYALKASDAETLGGLPASAFLRADATAASSATAAAAPAYINAAAVRSAASQAVANAPAVSSIAGTLPVFTDTAGTLGNSLVTQVTNSAGNFVGIGTATPTTALQIVGNFPILRMDSYSNTNGASPNLTFVSARGTATAPKPTLNGDNIAQFSGAGYNGSTIPGIRAKMSFLATQAWSATGNGTAITFQTTANNNTASAERLRIDNTGNVGIGTTAPAYPLSVNGTVQSITGGFKFPDNTTQTTAGLSGVVPFANGGTGATTRQGAVNALTGTQVGGTYLRSDGTNSVLNSIQPGDVPILNQNTTGTAGNVSGIVGVGNGGTGANTAAGGRANLGAAGNGVNGDIFALTALSTPLSVSQGGTGSNAQNFVDLSNPQTIAGTKTFTSSPVVPSPTTSTQAASKGYVDTATGGVLPANLTTLSKDLSTIGGVAVLGNQAYVYVTSLCMIGDIVLSVNGYGTGALPADGRLLPISTYTAAFSIMGTNFSGDGITTFGLPDLRGFAPQGLQYSICVNGIFPSRN